MRRLATMLLIPAAALLVAIAFEPSSAGEAPKGDAILTLPIESIAGWISGLFPGA